MSSARRSPTDRTRVELTIWLHCVATIRQADALNRVAQNGLDRAARSKVADGIAVAALLPDAIA